MRKIVTIFAAFLSIIVLSATAWVYDLVDGQRSITSSVF